VRLKNPVRVRFGAYQDNSGNINLTEYESVAHLYKEWYQGYFESTEYPLLMTRLEDIVFRTEDVVTAVCDCVGGTMKQNFTHIHDSANHGTGHGKHRTDGLFTAFVKHARLLDEYQSMFSESDKKIMATVFQQYPEMFDAFRYSLPLQSNPSYTTVN
jgi:hypothetical protein